MEPMRRDALRIARTAALALGAWSLAACAGAPPAAQTPAPPACWPSFPYQDGWLGGDGAYSVPLSSARTLWLFGDTFVGAPGQRDREGAQFVHKSIALSECGADGRFHVRYFWGAGEDGAQAFLEREGEGWWWLFGGFLHAGDLYVGLLEVQNAEPWGALSLPFHFSGRALARVRDPSGAPQTWQVEVLPLTRGGQALPLSAFAIDGGYLYLFGFRAGPDGKLPRILARLPLARLGAAPADLGGALETFVGEGGWVPGFVPDKAQVLMSDNASEMSVRRDSESGRWIAVYNYPDVPGAFPKVPPSDAVYARTAERIEGPWSERELIFRIPELAAARGGDPHTGCYAAKEHPQFSLPGSLTFTYVCNLFGGKKEDPFAILERLKHQMDLYRPVAVSVTLPEVAPEESDGR
jgi:hypothetical protein